MDEYLFDDAAASNSSILAYCVFSPLSQAPS